MTGVGDDSRGPRLGRPWFVVGSLFAVSATVVLVLSDDARWLRLGIVAALWAALVGAFFAAKYRGQASSTEDSVAQAQMVYELELEREIAARREYELEIEAETRDRVEANSREELDALRLELAALRESLQSLMGGEVLYERVALTAQATRMRSLQEQRVVQSASVARNGKSAPAQLASAPPKSGSQQPSPRPSTKSSTIEYPTELIERITDQDEAKRIFDSVVSGTSGPDGKPEETTIHGGGKLSGERAARQEEAGRNGKTSAPVEALVADGSDEPDNQTTRIRSSRDSPLPFAQTTRLRRKSSQSLSEPSQSPTSQSPSSAAEQDPSAGGGPINQVGSPARPAPQSRNLPQTGLPQQGSSPQELSPQRVARQPTSATTQQQSLQQSRSDKAKSPSPHPPIGPSQLEQTSVVNAPHLVNGPPANFGPGPRREVGETNQPTTLTPAIVDKPASKSGVSSNPVNRNPVNPNTANPNTVISNAVSTNTSAGNTSTARTAAGTSGEAPTARDHKSHGDRDKGEDTRITPFVSPAFVSPALSQTSMGADSDSAAKEAVDNSARSRSTGRRRRRDDGDDSEFFARSSAEAGSTGAGAPDSNSGRTQAAAVEPANTKAPEASSGGGRRRRPDGEPPAWQALVERETSAGGHHHAKAERASVAEVVRSSANAVDQDASSNPPAKGSHSSGRSVNELLAAHRAEESAPRRRRRAAE